MIVAALFLSLDSGNVVDGNVPLTQGSTRLLWSAYSQLVLNAPTGYLYNITNTRAVSQIWSMSGTNSDMTSVTFDELHLQYFTVTPQYVSAWNYYTKTIQNVANAYRILVIAFDTRHNTLYGLASSIGNTLVYQLDPLLRWGFVGVVPGYDPVFGQTFYIDDASRLVYFGSTGFSFNMLTVNLPSLTIVSAPVVAWPSPLLTICSA